MCILKNHTNLGIYNNIHWLGGLSKKTYIYYTYIYSYSFQYYKSDIVSYFMLAKLIYFKMTINNNKNLAYIQR